MLETITQPIFLILGAVALGVLVLHVFTTPRKGRMPAQFGRADPLVSACLGDRSKADRLMMYEIRRQPGISKAEARKRAFERLERDRGGRW